MEEQTHYEIRFIHNNKEIFIWKTGIIPIIPRVNESIFLVTNSDKNGIGSWWIVNEVLYQYHISEVDYELKQNIQINVVPFQK